MSAADKLEWPPVQRIVVYFDAANLKGVEPIKSAYCFAAYRGRHGILMEPKRQFSLESVAEARYDALIEGMKAVERMPKGTVASLVVTFSSDNTRLIKEVREAKNPSENVTRIREMLKSNRGKWFLRYKPTNGRHKTMRSCAKTDDYLE